MRRRTLDKNSSAKERWKELGFRNVIRLGYVSLFTDISTEMILGVLPVNFIIDQLGASPAVLGLIEGSAEAANYIFRVLAGFLTDKIAKRKPIVLIGYGLSTLAKPLFALATSWGQAFAVRVVDRAGKGTRTTPRDALISDSIPKSQAGKGFGLHGSLDQVGAVLGPLLAFALLPLIGLRNLFWISFIPGAISLFILLFFVADARARPRRWRVLKDARAVMTREFVLLLIVLEIFAVGAYNFSFILLEARSVGVPAGFIPLVYALLNLATVIIGFPAGILADRVGKLPVLGLSFMVFMGTSLAGVLLSGYWAFGLLIAFLYGGYLSISDTVQRAMIPDFTRPELKGTAYAVYYTLMGIGSLIANSVFGALWTSLGALVAFRFSIVTSAFAAVALGIFAVRGRILRNRGRRT
jgi:MFS family permease